MIRFSGEDVQKIFRKESGGHRWQRKPPNEKRGRIHTSTVTVAVLDEPDFGDVTIDLQDLDIRTTRGSGPGGQHRNTSDTAVIVTHRPTEISVKVERGRSQYQNKEEALRILRARIFELEKINADLTRADERRQQVGTGMRGDKIRTIRYQDGIVKDHRTGKKMKLRNYLSGHIEELANVKEE